MKFLVGVIVALCFVQALDARVVREAPQQVTFESLMNDAVGHFNNFTSLIKNALPSNEEFKTTLQTQATNLADKMQVAVTEFNAKAKDLSGNAQATLRQVADQFQTQVTNLRQQNPDAAQSAEKIKTSLNAVLTDVQRVHEALQPQADAMSESIKSAARTLLEQATLINNQIQQSATALH